MRIKELSTKSVSELNDIIENLKAELFMLRFQNATGQLEKPHKIALIKKDVARVFTVLKTKEDENESKAPVKPATKTVSKPVAKKPAAKTETEAAPKPAVKKEGE